MSRVSWAILRAFSGAGQAWSEVGVADRGPLGCRFAPASSKIDGPLTIYVLVRAQGRSLQFELDGEPLVPVGVQFLAQPGEGWQLEVPVLTDDAENVLQALQVLENGTSIGAARTSLAVCASIFSDLAADVKPAAIQIDFVVSDGPEPTLQRGEHTGCLLSDGSGVDAIAN